MPKPSDEQDRLLLGVTRARTQAKVEKEELRAHFAALLKEEIRQVDLKVDQAVRDAVDGECRIAWVERAYGTQDYMTIKRILDRTPSLKTIQAEAEANGAYSFTDDGHVRVTYLNHGPAKLTGSGVFDVVDLDGVPMFVMLEEGSPDPGEVYRMIDGELEGFYYSELAKWYKSQDSSGA